MLDLDIFFRYISRLTNTQKKNATVYPRNVAYLWFDIDPHILGVYIDNRNKKRGRMKHPANCRCYVPGTITSELLDEDKQMDKVKIKIDFGRSNDILELRQDGELFDVKKMAKTAYFGQKISSFFIDFAKQFMPLN